MSTLMPPPPSSSGAIAGACQQKRRPAQVGNHQDTKRDQVDRLVHRSGAASGATAMTSIHEAAVEPDSIGRPVTVVGAEPANIRHQHQSGPIVSGSGRLLATIWSSRQLQVIITVVAPGLYAVVAGWWTPRGPMTSSQALWAMAISVVVGAIAGVTMRSRWAMLVTPVVFLVGFELIRMGTDSTTVDAIHPGSTYGILALFVVRGFHGVVALAPMILAAAFGAAFARRVIGVTGSSRTRSRIGRSARRTVAVLATIGLFVLSFGLARPTSTAAIRGGDGKIIAGSIAELTTVNIGGHQLAMMIRGTSTNNPILLYLAGGPGGTDIGAMRNHLASLEEHFLVVTWDQRGTGKSYDQIDPISTLTFDNAVSDTIEVTTYLRHRFGHDTNKVYLVGNSYGTILGVRAAQQHPELYAAFIGTGQMVSPRETDRIIYADTLAWAQRTGNTGVVDQLTASGPPPYTKILDYEPALSHMDDVYPYNHAPNDEGAGGFSENLIADEYSLVDEAHNLAGFFDTFTIIYPQLQNIDFRVDATQLDIPVYIVEGRYEVRGRSELADQWFAKLQAPHKQMVVFDTSGHRPLFEQPAQFTEFITNTVLAETTPKP